MTDRNDAPTEDESELAQPAAWQLSALREAISALPHLQREALALAVRDRCLIADIAERTGGSEREALAAVTGALRTLRLVYDREIVAEPS